MIKDNQKYLNRAHVILDALIIVISYALSWYIRFRSGIFKVDSGYLSPQEYAEALFYIIPGYLILYGIFQLYTSKKMLIQKNTKIMVLE